MADDPKADDTAPTMRVRPAPEGVVVELEGEESDGIIELSSEEAQNLAQILSDAAKVSQLVQVTINVKQRTIAVETKK